jgi:hypothetical protein
LIRIASILLTSLLLYHTFRAGVVLYFLQDTYISASDETPEDEWVVVKVPVSLPYATDWEDTSGKEGLIKHGDQFYNIVEQRYQNDTLYTTLKTNISAREQFFSIVEEMNELAGKDAEKSHSKNPYTSLVKLLNQVSTVYIASYFTQVYPPLAAYYSKSLLVYQASSFVTPAFPVHTPPPKFS